MPYLLYIGTTLLIAAVDSLYREAPAYTAVNILLRILVLLPLLLAIVQGTSRYARTLRRTLWLVMAADILLPLYFPAGMLVFLLVHVLNTANFAQYTALRRDRLASIVLPGILAYSVSILLYAFLLYPAMDDLFRILVGLYLVPIALAWALSITCWVQHRSRWSGLAAAGMLLFFFTDLPVAAAFLADVQIPAYGLVNALTSP